MLGVADAEYATRREGSRIPLVCRFRLLFVFSVYRLLLQEAEGREVFMTRHLPPTLTPIFCWFSSLRSAAVVCNSYLEPFEWAEMQEESRVSAGRLPRIAAVGIL